MRPCNRGKVCHPTIEAAQAHARSVSEYDRRRGIEPRPGFVLEPYWCDEHSCFHIGHRRVPTAVTNEETI